MGQHHHPLPPSACNPSAPFPAGFAYRVPGTPRPGPSLGPCSGSVCVLPPERPLAGWGGHLLGGPRHRNPASSITHLFSNLGLTGQQRAPWPIPESPRSSLGQLPREARGENARRATREVQERRIRSLGGQGPLEEERATRFRILGQRSLASGSPWGRKESD